MRHSRMSEGFVGGEAFGFTNPPPRTYMTVDELMAILHTLPPGSQAPIVRGRHEPQIYASVPEGVETPMGWGKAAEPPHYYPEGTRRVKWIGPPNT